MGDILFVVAFLTCINIPTLIFWFRTKRPQWFITTASMSICLGLGELWSKISNGYTLSKDFWNMSLLNSTYAWIWIGLWIFAWSILIIHLLWKKMMQNVKK